MNAPLTWLEPLNLSLPELDDITWQRLARLADDLEQATTSAPTDDDGRHHPTWLTQLRRGLARRGHRAPAGLAGPIWQTLAQFVAGFYDLDLRDVTGHGHGAMILHHGTPPVAAAWERRLRRGDLVGIAATEAHGGSRVREITTHAVSRPDGRWAITGQKRWVSRLNEAAAFVVFFRDPTGRLTAAVIDAHADHLHRLPVDPAGLAGWSWGAMNLDGVLIDPATDLIGAAGCGLDVFRRHFARFRPLVTATALGTAAGIHTHTLTRLAERVRSGQITRLRDNALIALGRTHAEITAALLATLTAARLAAVDHPAADLATRTGKAAGVDTAHRAVLDLAPLVGAAGFQRGSPFAKARADLTGLLYADGIHDSLYRSGGQTLIAAANNRTPATSRRQYEVAA